MRHPGALILVGLIALTAVLTAAPAPAHAAFHLWKIKEVYSNADGTIQYIELFSSTGGQGVLANHTIVATSTTGGEATTRTFTFPADLVGSTATKHLLIATPGFARLSGATPDYTLPCGPFFTPGADTITINFGEGSSSITFTGRTLPVDGTSSLTVTPLDSQTVVAGTNSPTNFAGTADPLDLTGCANAMCDVCDDGLFCTGAESCSGSACVAAGACEDICDEDADTCVECNVPADCDDGNPCTTEACTLNACVITNNTLACDDGLFCTLTDVCGGGSCGGSGDACPGQNCLEGSDTCGDCTIAADCDDGTFCNGAETCSAASACESAAAPPCVDGIETCDETGELCERICGNGVLDGDEVCDDGNAENEDGCGEGCSPEEGWTCDGAEPTTCTEDVAPAPDAGVADPDAGTTEPPASEDDGCCSTGAPRTGSALLSLLVLGLLLRRRAHR